MTETSTESTFEQYLVVVVPGPGGVAAGLLSGAG